MQNDEERTIEFEHGRLNETNTTFTKNIEKAIEMELMWFKMGKPIIVFMTED